MVETEFYNFQIKNMDEYYLFRYFHSLPRLESFLKEGIYLTRADKFSDNLECVPKNVMIEVNKSKYFGGLLPKHNSHLSKTSLSEIKDQYQHQLRQIATNLKDNQKKYFISCWYISDSKLEDELMWRSYGRGLEENKPTNGYMVRINLKDFIHGVKRLSSALNPFDKLILGQVRYYDFSNDESMKEVRYTAFRKHASFSSEKEFRILFINRAPDEASRFIKPPAGFYEDTVIYSHPNIEEEQFFIARRRLREFGKDLNGSELQMWYKLKFL